MIWSILKRFLFVTLQENKNYCFHHISVIVGVTYESRQVKLLVIF